MRTSWIVMVALAALMLAACDNASLTGDCTTADDCNGGLDGTCGWVCVEGRCEVECMGDCDTADDCIAYTDGGCTATCVRGRCQWDCPEHCLTVDDCEVLTWPINCVGHWECKDAICEAVCDE